MKSHHLATTLLLLCAAATADSPAPIRPHLHFSGGRPSQQSLSPNARKMDSALAEVAQHMKVSSVQPSASDLLMLNPGAKFIQRTSDATPLVSVDAITRGDPQQLERQLIQLGLQRPAVYSNDVGGWLPVSQIEAAAALTELHSIRAAMSRTRSGAVTTQGDFAQHSSSLRTTYPTLTGAGITVGVLSDSYNCYPTYAKNNVPASGFGGYAPNGFTATATDDVNSGDLPTGVQVLGEAPCMDYGAPSRLPFGDEGRAIMQIVHDVAPSAGLSFYTAENSEADFAAGIGALQTAGAKVIVDDVGYFDEPFFQDGQIAQAIDAVAAKGVAYFSSAANEGTNAYDNTSPSFTTLSNTAPTTGEYLLNFDNSGATNTTSLSVDIPALRPGYLVAVVLEWDQPYVTGAPGSPGASSHLDLCIATTGTDPIIGYSGSSACTGPNSTGQDPVQVLIINNPANSTGYTALETVQITVGLADGTAPPGRIKLAVEGNGLSTVIHGNYAKNPTLQGHPGAAGAAAVGAAAFYKTPGCGVTTAVLESFSSQGGTPILFDKTGTKLQTPIMRQKPNFVAPDGGNDTFLGYKATGDMSSVSQCANNTSYPNFFGTSAAAPHAAAIAALLLQADSTLTPAQIYGAMQASALPMATPSPDVNTGYGFIQADATFSALKLSAPPAQPASNPPAASSGGGGGGGALDGLVLCMLGGLGAARLLQQRRALGRAHHNRAGDLVVPGLMVVVNGNPDKAESDHRQG
ncbi:MAG: S8 family serine peptidase [Proteobacteria bacterium]|nr:S8 family serine peptidase [Pseudomonadota bacterium]